MIPALLIGTDKYDIGKYFEFKLPYFQENLYMMMFLLPAGIVDGILAGSTLICSISAIKNHRINHTTKIRRRVNKSVKNGQ